jgi:hypothetical protein
MKWGALEARLNMAWLRTQGCPISCRAARASHTRIRSGTPPDDDRGMHANIRSLPPCISALSSVQYPILTPLTIIAIRPCALRDPDHPSPDHLNLSANAQAVDSRTLPSVNDLSKPTSQPFASRLPCYLAPANLPITRPHPSLRNVLVIHVAHPWKYEPTTRQPGHGGAAECSGCSGRRRTEQAARGPAISPRDDAEHYVSW